MLAEGLIAELMFITSPKCRAYKQILVMRLAVREREIERENGDIDRRLPMHVCPGLRVGGERHGDSQADMPRK